MSGAVPGMGNANDRVRIEILEEQVQRIAGGSGGGSTFAGPIVNRETAASPGSGSTLDAVVAPDGEQVFVLTHRSIWTKRNGVAGTQGVPPLFPHEVIAALDGTGVFCRTEYSDPALRTGINDVFIDPANVLANDENDGLTALTPLATGYELFRRWGWDVSKPIVGPNFATSPTGSLNINIQSDIVSPDSLPIKVTVAHDATLRVVGGPSTILRTSTLTDAVTAANRAAPLGGQRLVMRDNTLVAWAAFMVPNRRVRFTNGPAAGGTCQPQTDAVATPGQAQFCNCQTTSEPTFSTAPTTVTPAVGNTYVVESLVVCNLGQIDISQEINPTFGGFDVFVNIIDLNLPNIGSEAWVPKTDAGGFGGVFLNMYQCTIDRSIEWGQCNGIGVALLYGAVAISCSGGLGFNPPLNGGGANGAIPSGGPGSVLQIVLNDSRPDPTADADFCANLAGIFAVTTNVRNCASWNALPVAGPNTAGHGMSVGGGGTSPFFGIRGAALFKGTVWGGAAGQNPGAGMQICAGCTGVGPPQNITGAQGDCKLADFSATVGNNTYWQAATGVDVGATGAAGVASASSWAFITAAKAAPGYGGSVHNRDQNASFVANESSA